MKFRRLKDGKSVNPDRKEWRKKPFIAVKAGEIIEGDRFTVVMCLDADPTFEPANEEAQKAVDALRMSPKRRAQRVELYARNTVRDELASEARDNVSETFERHSTEIAEHIAQPMLIMADRLEELGCTSTETLRDPANATPEELDQAVADVTDYCSDLEASADVTEALKLLKG